MREPIGYLHIETDTEFRRRIYNETKTHLPAETGVYLDSLAWSMLKKQRRIVTVYP